MCRAVSVRFLCACGVLELLLFVAGCSRTKYQSFVESGFGEQVASRMRWEAKLPYQASDSLEIVSTSGGEVLLSDPQSQFHLTKIPLGPEGRPAGPLHREIENGDVCERIGPGSLLVTGDRSRRKFITVVDAGNLTTRFSAALAFQPDADISVPGHKQIDDTLIYYRSNLAINHYSSSDGVYEYSTPYVRDGVYDIHMVDLRTGETHSFEAIKSDSLPSLASELAAAKLVAAAPRMPDISGVSSPSRRRVIDGAIYLLDQFFLMDEGRTLIFSLANLNDDRLYYLADVRRGAQSIESHSARELVERYPTELVSTPKQPKEKLDEAKSRDLDISGKVYSPDRFSVLSHGIVMLARVKLGEDRYSPNRFVVGLRMGDEGVVGLERKWEYGLKHEMDIRSVLEDPYGNAVYFPEVDQEGALRLIGFDASDGRQLQGFPANFRIEKKDGKKLVQVVGTAVDFERNLLFLHDASKNRIVCAALREAPR